MAWLANLLDMTMAGLPKATLALCPDHLKQSTLARLGDHNPFKTISANHDLVRATRLAWIEAAQVVLKAAHQQSGRANLHDETSEIASFDKVISGILLKTRDLALDCRKDPGALPHR